MHQCIVCLVVFVFANWVSAQLARIEKADGDVEKIDGLGKRHPAARGITLKDGETLATGSGAAATLAVCPTISLDLREQSTMTLIRINKASRIVKALAGTISFSVAPKAGSPLEVQTAFFLCTCSAGVFRFDLDRDQAVVSVSKGKIAILDSETRALKMEVLHGETAMIGAPFQNDVQPIGNEHGAVKNIPAAAEGLSTVR